ncbi:MAG: hypothetical protein RLZZ312_467 [Bacteroidota bacterium]
MKQFLLALLLVFSTPIFSQNTEKSIIVKDASTNLPIEDALIVLLKTKQNVLTNIDGKATFVLKSATSIAISHTSYNKINIKSTLLTANLTEVFLKNNTNDLEELVITKNPQKMLKNLVENSKKRLTIPARLKVYAREFFKLNGKYAYYNDGLINFQIFGKTTKFDSNILVEQNRAFGLLDKEISQDLLGYNLNDIMENYYNFKYLSAILDPSAKKKYDFVVKVFSKNKQYNVYSVQPLNDTDGLLDNYSIVYEPRRNLIVSVTTIIPATRIANYPKKTGSGSKNITKSQFKSIYKFDDDNYHLVSSKEEIAFEKIERKEITTYEVRHYFVTTNFSNQNYNYNESDVFKDKTLFNKKNQILTEYWNVSGITQTAEEEVIIKEIESN